MSSPHRCGGCDSTWGGLRQAHCTACHRTLSSPDSFDLHQKPNSCVDPKRLGMELHNNVWRFPEERLPFEKETDK